MPETMTAADGIAYLTTLPANEPIFILRGQDTLAAPTVFDWALRAERHNVSTDKVHGALVAGSNMLHWPVKKLPD